MVNFETQEPPRQADGPAIPHTPGANGHAPEPSTPPPDRGSWAPHAAVVAAVVDRMLVNRRDAYGGYKLKGGKVVSRTRKTEYGDPPVSVELLVQHFRGAHPTHVIGGHAIDPATNACLWVGVDIDKHGDKGDAPANFRFALALYAYLRSCDLAVLLVDSNGRGGFHVWIVFDRPIPSTVAYQLGRWLVRDWRDFGLDGEPESFPKQRELNAATPCGNWLRYPGRNPKNGHWSRVWDGEKGDFLEGGDAALSVARFRPGDPDSIPADALGFQPTEGTQPPRPYKGDRSRDAELARLALEALPADYYTYDKWIKVGFSLYRLGYQGLALWVEWSSRGPGFEPGACEAKWLTMTEAGLTLASLLDWAKKAGWKRPKLPKGKPTTTTPPAPSTTPAGEPAPATPPPGPADLQVNEAIDDPHRIARVVLGRHLDRRGNRLLVHHRDVFYLYSGTSFREADTFENVRLVQLVKDEIDQQNLIELQEYEELLAKFNAGTIEFKPKKPVAVKVTRNLIANVRQALVSMVSIGNKEEAPFWITHFPDAPDAMAVLPLRNGLLDTSGDEPKLLPHTPEFFATATLGYSYDKHADESKAPLWFGALREQWPDDAESIDTLHELFGDALAPDIRRHVIGLIVGPTRSLKGTCRQVLTALVGAHNVGQTSPAILGDRFGLEPLLGKRVGIMADARAGDSGEAAVMMDRLMRISGGDPVEVNRKGKPILNDVQMKLRFVYFSNDFPNLRDNTGAVAGRLVYLETSKSIPDEKQDPLLADKIIKDELPAILNRALAGLKELRKRGRFKRPTATAGLMQETADNASPMQRFVDERLLITPTGSYEVKELFEDWTRWAIAHGYAPGNDGTFCRNLRAVVRTIRKERPRVDGKQVPTYLGIEKATEPWESLLTPPPEPPKPPLSQGQSQGQSQDKTVDPDSTQLPYNPTLILPLQESESR